MISALTCSGVTQVVDSNLVPTFASLWQYTVLPSCTRGKYPRSCADFAVAAAAAAASGDGAAAAAVVAGLAPGAFADGALSGATAGVANVGALEGGAGWGSVPEAGSPAPASRPVMTKAVNGVIAEFLTCIWHS